MSVEERRITESGYSEVKAKGVSHCWICWIRYDNGTIHEIAFDFEQEAINWLAQATGRAISSLPEGYNQNTVH